MEEGLVVAVPWIGFHREGIGGIRGAFMVSVNYFDVFENIRSVHLWIFSAPDMRHIAPVVRSCGGQKRLATEFGKEKKKFTIPYGTPSGSIEELKTNP